MAIATKFDIIIIKKFLYKKVLVIEVFKVRIIEIGLYHDRERYVYYANGAPMILACIHYSNLVHYNYALPLYHSNLG